MRFLLVLNERTSESLPISAPQLQVAVNQTITLILLALRPIQVQDNMEC
jgi:hypothetical protein